jgi:hypothetical protein
MPPQQAVKYTPWQNKVQKAGISDRSAMAVLIYTIYNRYIWIEVLQLFWEILSTWTHEFLFFFLLLNWNYQ